MPSRIEWTDETWNPVAGCTLVSEGCRNCYAMRMAHRMNPSVAATHMGRAKYDGTTKSGPNGPVWTGVVRTVLSELEKPLRWRKPRRVFVCSMSDLFHPGVQISFIDSVFLVMRNASQHTYQILTKRPEIMDDFLRHHATFWPLPNVWIGTSIENQATADWRIPHLLRCPATVRFLSYEPALGPVNVDVASKRSDPIEAWADANRIDWVIAGGESGPGARPAHPDWFRSMRDQCRAAGVPFFFKQWGAWMPYGWADAQGYHIRRACVIHPDGVWNDRQVRELLCDWPGDSKIQPMALVGKKLAGRGLDGQTWDEMSETVGVTDAQA